VVRVEPNVTADVLETGTIFEYPIPWVGSVALDL
ncbi:uncharacterized protein METZ01_LOCUS233738, partial [marine metagenome]